MLFRRTAGWSLPFACAITLLTPGASVATEEPSAQSSCIETLVTGEDPVWLRQPRVLFVHGAADEVTGIVGNLQAVGIDPRHERADLPASIELALRKKWNLWIVSVDPSPLGWANALDLLTTVKRRIPMIFILSNPSLDASVALMRAGAKDCLSKAALARLPAAVVQTLRAAHDRRRRMGLMRQRLIAQSEMARLFDLSQDILTVASTDGKFLRVNPAFTNILGCSEYELLTTPILERVHPDDRTPTQGQLSRLQNGNVVTYFENRYQAKDGSYRTIAWSSSPGSAGENVIFAVGRDITEVKGQIERERQTVKMEALGQLAAGIAHDFNNLLTMILGFSDILRTQSVEPLNVEMLNQVISAGTRATDLVRRINAFGRRSNGEKKPIKLETVVGDVWSLLRASLPKTVDLVRDFDAQLRPVMADPGQIHQVVLNLATNAAHALREKNDTGTVTLSVKETTVREEIRGAIDNVMPGTYIRLSVSDTGVGMPPAILARIFEPYFTTKPIGEGTGLGLAVVHGLVREHGARLVVTSTPGRGTTFDIYFSIQGGLSSTGVLPSTTAEEFRSGAGKTVLFVEDEAAIRALGHLILLPLGYAVELAEDAVQASEMFRRHPSRYDIVITDLSMPRISGLQFARGLRRDGFRVPVILVTGYGDSVRQEDIAAAGIYSLLAKPVNRADLVRAIERALEVSDEAE